MNQHSYSHSLRRRITLLAACGLPVVAWPASAAPHAFSGPFTRLATMRVADVPVSGRVVQANGSGLPGVTIVVKGTTVGTSSGADGTFSLNVPEGSTLVVSSVGFIKQEVAVTGATNNLTISLLEDRQALSEVVVVGYGTQERGSVTGAISSVSGPELTRQPVADVTQALQGKASGVTVTSNGGAPGGAAGTSVRIRGITSNGNNNPLYIVDGFPLSQNSESQLNAISPNDIETIDILKDASATAIYGVRAANGVVIITTKRGKTGKTSVNLDAYRGVNSVIRRLDLLTAEQYAVINNESRIAGGLPIVLDKLRDPAALGKGTDWQDELFRQAKIQNYSLSANGGSENARFAISGTYFQQDGTILGSNFERFTVRANGDVQLSKAFKMGTSISLSHLTDRQVTTNDGEYGTLQQLIRIPATVPAYRPDGYFYDTNAGADNFIEENPLATATRNNQQYTANRAITTLFAELEPVKGLRFRTQVGADFFFDNFNSFSPTIPELVTPDRTYTSRYSTASAEARSSYAPSYLIENTATYSHLFAEKHQVTFLLGQSAQEFNYSNVVARRQGYLRNDLQTINAGPNNTLQSNEGTVNTPARLASYFGRLNYEFAGKYLFQAVARYDGSGQFPPGNKFGFFPAVSAGWRISEEDFMKENSTISNLKLRGGYGKTGNPLNAGRFGYLYAVNFGISYPLGPDGTLITGGAPTKLANPDLRWENNNQANIGLDMGFLQNRLEASIDFYQRTSPNLIAAVPVSLVSGTYEPFNSNAASAYNRGIDFSLTSHNFVGAGRAFSWTTTLNASTYKTKLTNLGAGLPYNGPNTLNGYGITRYDVGTAFGSFYGFVADGLIQTAEELKTLNAGAKDGSAGATYYQTQATAPGDIKFRDLNGDGTITAADRQFIGNPNPDFTYGITNTMNYKGFDLSFFIQGSQGNDIYNLNKFLTESALYGTFNGGSYLLNRWTGPGTSTTVPRAINGDPNGNLRSSTYFVEDGSYIRLKNITFGYSLPTSITNRIWTKQIRLYVTGQNLVTLTKYTGYDPEVTSGGIDRGIYPQSRTIMGGINVGF